MLEALCPPAEEKVRKERKGGREVDARLGEVCAARVGREDRRRRSAGEDGRRRCASGGGAGEVDHGGELRRRAIFTAVACMEGGCGRWRGGGGLLPPPPHIVEGDSRETTEKGRREVVSG
jgi:hypothetical protein